MKTLIYCVMNKMKIKFGNKSASPLGNKNVKLLQKDTAPLRHIFASFWHKESKYLLLWKKYFQSNQLLFQQAISNIKKLSGIKYFRASKIPIYLISDSVHKDKEIHAWFSWSPQKSFIVVEIPAGLKPPSNLLPMGILAHEFFHLILRENKALFSKISNIVEKNKKLFTKLSGEMSNRMFLEELLISSFIPEGYLGAKYFRSRTVTNVTKPNTLLMWRRFIAHKLNQTTKYYVNNARQIDEKYLKNIIKAIRQK